MKLKDHTKKRLLVIKEQQIHLKEKSLANKGIITFGGSKEYSSEERFQDYINEFSHTIDWIDDFIERYCS